MMSRIRTGSVGLLSLFFLATTARANEVALCPQIQGKVIDYTRNHGADRRIWSEALCQRRDLYVYLPPGYDPMHAYPTMVFLHGLGQDEQFFLHSLVPIFDEAIVSKKLPPLIIAAPDGTISGTPSLRGSATFFINSRAGRFMDYLRDDVWSFLTRTYPVRPERQAHVLASTSMSGTGAFRLAMENQDKFGMVIGVHPSLNLRWVDCHGKYRRCFSPDNWGWRTCYRPNEIVALFKLVPIFFKSFSDPLFARDEVIAALCENNPIEIMDRVDLKDGQLAMYVAYGSRDQFHMDAQVESFLHRAYQRGVSVGVGYAPGGKHDFATAVQLLPGIFEWANVKLSDYSPVKTRSKDVTSQVP